MKRPVCAAVGAGEGLGVALAKTFASAGFDVGLVAGTKEGAQPAVSAAVAEGARVEIFEADARRPTILTQALFDMAETLGDIEVLIYNPRGPLTFKAPLDLTPTEFRELLDLEVIGALAAAQAVLPAMLRRARGTILYSSAAAGLGPLGQNLMYATGKSGLRAMAQSLSKAYASKGVHVVHVLLDCMLDVPLLRHLSGKGHGPLETATCEDVAQSYLWAHRQPQSAWSNEIELRPFSEAWTH